MSEGGCVLILTADTGGGHNATSSALAKGFQALEGGPGRVVVTDLLKNEAPWPFNRLGANYRWLATRPPFVLEWVFWLDNQRFLSQLLYTLSFPILRPALEACLARHRPDVVIGVHPHYTQLLPRLGGPPLVTMASDLLRAPVNCFSVKSDLAVVATPTMRDQALGQGLAPNQIEVTGLPIDLTGRDQASKENLGLKPDLPVVLVVGGGEGYGGPMERIVATLGTSSVPFQIVVITGRNHALRERLADLATVNPLVVRGFVNSLVPFLAVASLLVTKAGPSTLAESFACGVPSLIFGNFPGPEEANVNYVVEHGAGLFCPQPEAILAATERWLDSHPQERQQASQRALTLGQPAAALDAARIIWNRFRPCA